ncbi:Panacea domain-containing protein [Paenibacillus sp. FSL K6-2524]|uniref:Panacea domain-containing protein n=1 Tax=Paenibacillus sp. FSL K6-2524 TaxID=2954516 RepID=UPI0030F68C04
MNSVDVAKWFIVNNHDVTSESWDSKIKLQKLIFYSQAMHLAKAEEPLFPDKIEAWRYGPVVREVNRQVEHEHLIPTVNFQGANFDCVDSDIIHLLKTVNFIYGHKTSHELVGLTHSEEPWKALEEKALRAENPVITLDSIRSYYRPLKEIFEAHKDFDFDSHKVEFINGNRFVYNYKETSLTDVDKEELWGFGFEETSGSFFIYKDEEGELVVY